jgi:hypothetical protein
MHDLGRGNIAIEDAAALAAVRLLLACLWFFGLIVPQSGTTLRTR